LLYPYAVASGITLLQLSKSVSQTSLTAATILLSMLEMELLSHSKSHAFSLAQAVAAKLEDGNLRAAIRLLNSDDTPDAPSEENLRILQDKHPLASGTCLDLLAATPTSCLEVTRIGSAPGSSFLSGWVVGGPDGLRPQHLKDLVLYRESGSDFLGDLTAFVDMVLAGSCPKDIAPYFFGGRLLALSKKFRWVTPDCDWAYTSPPGFEMCQLFWVKASGFCFLSSSAWRRRGWRMRGGCALSSSVSTEHAKRPRAGETGFQQCFQLPS